MTAVLIAVAGLGVSCGRPKLVNSDDEPDVMVKHNWRQMSSNGWNVEVWATGAVGSVGGPMNLVVRLSSANEQALPKITFIATLTKKGNDQAVLRRVELVPTFKETAKMK